MYYNCMRQYDFIKLGKQSIIKSSVKQSLIIVVDP